MITCVSLTRLREAAHVSSTTARRALDAAGIKPDANGHFPLDESLAAIDLQRDPSKRLGKLAAGQGAITAPATAKPASDRVSAAATLAEARARSEIARARKLELDNLRAEQAMLDKDTVVKAGQHFAAHMRAGLMGFGPSVAASLVGLPADQMAQRITAAMRDLLGRLGDVQDFVLDRELA